MHHHDDEGEARILRERIAALETAIDALPAKVNLRTPVLLGSVYQQTTIPTLTGRFYAVHPTRVSGVTAENAVATLAADTSRTEYFRVIGNQAPVAGDVLVGRHVDHRWQAETWKITPAVTTVVLTGCPCNIPTTLTMTPGSGVTLYQTTMTYQTRPADLSVTLGATGFWSDPFTDPVSGCDYRYRFLCGAGVYGIELDPLTGQSAPCSVGGTISTYLIGFTGNTCSPFRMSRATGQNITVTG